MLASIKPQVEERLRKHEVHQNVMEGQAFQNEDGTPIDTDEEAQLETMK